MIIWHGTEYIYECTNYVGDEYAVFRGITLEEADDLSLIFKGITFEVADKKLMDILFFGQS